MKYIVSFIILIAAGFSAMAQEQDLHYRELYGFLKPDARKEIRIPDILGYQTLKCDFHMHTIFSDGMVIPAERVNEAWREGLDVIAITDHHTPQPDYISANYNTSCDLAESAAQRRGVTLIRGIEYTKSKPEGHLNLLFVEDANIYVNSGLPPEEVISLAAENGAFVVYNHPGWPDKNSDLFDFQINLMNEKKIHAIEVINSNEFYPVAVDYCWQYNLAPLSTTDIHAPVGAKYDTEHNFRNLTLVFARDKSQESVKEALFAGRTVAFGNNLVIGKEEYLRELIRQSLEVSDFRIQGTEFFCDVKNISDINWLLDGSGQNRIVFPANRTIQLSGESGKLDMIFQVSNSYIGSDKHMMLPLYFFLAGKQEVSVPYFLENPAGLEPGTGIAVLCATDGADIRYTLDGSVPDQHAVVYHEPIVIEQSAILSLKAFKEGMNPSRTFRKQIVLNTLHQAEKIRKPVHGVNYRYFEGNFLSVQQFEKDMISVGEGTVDFPDLSVAGREDHFGLIFSGYIYAPSDGVYTFSTQSDDGSVLKISGIRLVENDGSHGLTKVSASIGLKKGYHPYELLYMEDYEGQELRFLWTVPGGREEPVGKDYLSIPEK